MYNEQFFRQHKVKKKKVISRN
uniref:Uncharacterized protein n=1 Tax=Rhizophora mucronata TaxID=61149 RepID=A0A2P2R579_RHIMU